MADSYFELLGSDDHGERFRAGDLVRGTWTPAIQHGGPVSALLVRGLEHCEPRYDTRLTRVLVDLRRAETSYGPDGIGTTIGTLFDERGPVGAIQQSVLVRRRPTS